MVRVLTALLFTLAVPAWAGALEERLAACQEGFADCREDCTTSYGSSFKLREQLGRCLGKCTRRKDECRGRHLELDQAQIDEDGYERKRPGQELAGEPSRREVPAAPPPRRAAPKTEPRPPPAEENGPAASEEPDAAEAPPQRAPQAERTHQAAEGARTEARPAASPRPAAAPAQATATEEEEAAPHATPPSAPSEDDAAREGARKLMQKGAEDWDPDAD
jgi:hypothetical protein